MNRFMGLQTPLDYCLVTTKNKNVFYSRVQIWYVSSNFLRLLLGNHDKDKDVFYPHAKILYVSSSYPLLMLDNHIKDKDV